MFERMDKRVKKQFIRLVFLYDEIDHLRDEYPVEEHMPVEIEHTIKTLYKQINKIRNLFLNDKHKST